MSDIGASITADNITTVLAHEAVLVPLSRRVLVTAFVLRAHLFFVFILTWFLIIIFVFFNLLDDRILFVDDFGFNLSLNCWRLLFWDIFTVRIIIVIRRVLIIMLKSFLTSIAAAAASSTCCGLHILFLCSFSIFFLLSATAAVRLISWLLIFLLLRCLVLTFFITWLKVLHKVITLEVALLESRICCLLLTFCLTETCHILTLSILFRGFIFVRFVCAVNLSNAELFSSLLKNPQSEMQAVQVFV